MLVIDTDQGIVDDGIAPLAHFVDSAGPNAVAVALESNGRDDPYPAVNVRRDGEVTEHLLEPHLLLNCEGDEYQEAMIATLDRVLSPSLSQPQR